MKQVQSNWVPLCSFAVAVLMSLSLGPGRSALGRRAADTTGPCNSSHEIEHITANATGFEFTLTDPAIFHVTTSATSNLEYMQPFITYHATMRIQKIKTAVTHTEKQVFTLSDEGQAIEMPVAGELADAEIEIPGSFTFTSDAMADYASANAKLGKNEALIGSAIEGPQSVKLGVDSQFICFNTDGTSGGGAPIPLEGALAVDASGTAKKPKTFTPK